MTRFLVRAGIVAAVLAVSISLAACSSAQSSAPATQAGTPAPAPATAAAPAAATAASAGPAAKAGPTAADGRAVVKSSCIGQCHGSSLLTFRTSSTTAQRIASGMGRRAGLSTDKQQAVALFLAQ